MNVKSTIIVSTALAAFFLLAGSSASAAVGWDVQWRKISMLYPVTWGFVMFTTGTPEINPTGVCEKNRVGVRTDHPNYEVLVASLLTAYTAGHEVMIAFDDTTLGSCDLIIDRVKIRPPAS